MPRGGKRDKAGRPSTWASGCKFEDTRVIRVPKEIADRLLEIAHKLDAKEPIELVTKSETATNKETKQLEILKDSLTTTLDVPIEFAERLSQVLKRMQASHRPRKRKRESLGVICPDCGSNAINKHGHDYAGRPSFICTICRHRFGGATAIKGF